MNIRPSSPLNIRPSSPLSSPPPPSSPPHSRHSSLERVSSTRTARKRRRLSQRRPPRSDQQKLDHIQLVIKENGWTLRNLLEAYEKNQSNTEYRTFWSQFKKFAYGRSTLEKSDWERMFSVYGIDYVVHHFRKEMKRLGKTGSFGSFQHAEVSDHLRLGSLESLDSLAQDMSSSAPDLVRFLRLLGRPAHNQNKEPPEPGPHQIALLSMLLYSMQRKKCNNLPRCIGMYLVNSGVQKRIVDIMSSIGLCASYSTVQDVLKVVTNVGRKQVSLLARNPCANMAHDNFDFPEHRSGERIGDKKKFHSITNGIIFIGHHMEQTGLRQSTWHPERLFQIPSLLEQIRLGEEDFYRARSRFCYQAIEAGLPGIRHTELAESMHALFPWPTKEHLRIAPVRYHPMAPVFENEGTNDGTLAICGNYMEDQCQLKTDDERWSTLLTQWHGDVKTILRLRSVQALRKKTSRQAYDTLEWIHPTLGLWHLRYNLLKLFHRTHWGGSQPSDSSTLQYAADAWGRTNVNVPTDFAKLEDLLIHSYQARILGLFVTLSGLEFTRREDAEEWVQSLGKEEVQRRLLEVTDTFNPHGFDSMDSTRAQNQIWNNHQCFIRHMNTYFMLRFSIKFADIGILPHALREVAILTQAKESKCDNYGPELLRVLHVLDSNSSAIRLRKAFLANMLVNLSGDPEKNFEVDRLVEFLNRLVSISKRDRMSSTKPLEELLAQIVLTAPYLLENKLRLERTIGRTRKGNHPPKDASEDIWTMAMDLSRKDFKTRNQPGFSAFPAVNLRRSGFQSLGQNVMKYNYSISSGLSLDAEDPDSPGDGQEENNSTSFTADEEMDRLLQDIS